MLLDHPKTKNSPDPRRKTSSIFEQNQNLHIATRMRGFGRLDIASPARTYWILSNAFSASFLDGHVISVLRTTHMVDCICWFAHIKCILHPWDGQQPDYVFLNSSCNYSDENFYTDGHQRNWFFIMLCVFGIMVILVSQTEFNGVPSLSVVWNSVRSIGVSPSMSIW